MLIQININQILKIEIKLLDIDLNKDSQSIDNVEIIVESTSGDEEVFFLFETNINSGIFTSKIQVRNGAPLNDSILQVSNGDSVFFIITTIMMDQVFQNKPPLKQLLMITRLF
ncbi:MAG: hypothetical protein OMM_12040 [Candidatus Magnetoglobus multicellularis str. Araruama]|uniref:Uncharacterized protein n=1 Tax=Candidatus Magnetoglobus multicellularis str. Araruama TaxID=890399 RepID=A0A1V1NWU8_9BACT|nr:MAG: hypothetical protein OMM_12040 [Candidatus Magnetoglobus multicellularis str. Araruama]